MLNLIERHNSWPKIIGLAGVVFGVWYLMLGVEAEFSNSIGKPTLPDFAVREVNLADAVGSYSPVAIEFYLTRFVPLDFVFPVLLGGLLAACLSRLGAPRRAVLLPIAAAAFDYLENTAIITVLLTAEAPLAWVGILASFLTKVKFAAYTAAAVALFVLIFRRVMSQNR